VIVRGAAANPVTPHRRIAAAIAARSGIAEAQESAPDQRAQP
jgi:hypothetical protein